MRSDLTLYVVAVFFFALTVTSAIIFQQEERSLWMVSTAFIGILSLSLGVYQRPKTKSVTQKIQTISESNTQTVVVQTETPFEQTPIIETVATETVQTIEAPAEPSAPKMPKEKAENLPQTEAAPVEAAPLTNVKGIGEKRAAQLNALGINTAAELSKASVEELAKQLKISPKIVAKWVEAAKQ